MPLPFEEADELAKEIWDFLLSLEDPYGEKMYEDKQGYFDTVILTGLAVDQYALIRDKDTGDISVFALYWFINQEDLDGCTCEDLTHRVAPKDIKNGDICYIAESASVGNRRDYIKMVRHIKNHCKEKNINVGIWNNANKDSKLSMTTKH